MYKKTIDNFKKTVLVTGGAGFIGSHLCEALLKKGYYVICVDNFFTGRKENIQHLLNHENFELIRHDVTQPFFVEADEIYHLACPASPPHYQYNPIKTAKTNFIGTYNMLGVAKRTNAKILLASTSEVYGDPEIHPQHEEYRGHVNMLGPRACYDEGKRVAETLMMDYHRQHDTDVRIVRIFNTYGPNMDPNDGRVVSNFIMQALQNKNITIFGDGSQTRSFQYVSDLVKGMILMMEQNNFKGPVNLGNPHELSIKELAEQVIKKTKSSSKIIFEELPADDPERRKPDISLAKKKLNWEPSIAFNKGITSTIDYFSDFLKKTN